MSPGWPVRSDCHIRRAPVPLGGGVLSTPCHLFTPHEPPFLYPQDIFLRLPPSSMGQKKIWIPSRNKHRDENDKVPTYPLLRITEFALRGFPCFVDSLQIGDFPSHGDTSALCEEAQSSQSTGHFAQEWMHVCVRTHTHTHTHTHTQRERERLASCMRRGCSDFSVIICNSS